MRLLAVLGVIFALFIVLGIWTNHTIAAAAESLAQNIDQIMTAAEKEDWQRAGEETKALENSWRKKANWWPVFLDHQEIDNIEFNLARIKEYIAQKNIDLSLGHLSELKLMIQHIPEKEAVTIKNIL
ncbi:putative PurR-regulated permease PerM [Desulfohalotomaculum tongense]|uniref:DUF4363 family protein n=1 Tax=Desulforadius tongensis TaxID=1216062 RepID=UPI001956D077|nr:DUF4363 family protein [Desulforadius tongensis]MBM7855295.1 putative PurR-regulated permease PerM [Desulforadius tongensis]